jgi:hypothetical protein
MTTGPDGNPNNTLPLRDLVGNKFWEKNVVHDYSSVTYDITLAMTTTPNARRWLGYEASGGKDAEEINSLDNKEIFRDEIIILAQTASTITQITRLDIEGYASPNQRSNLTYSTKMKADVVQPQGQSLIRNIYKAAGMLGIENHYSHPYFLQIYLKGRTKDGSEIVQEIPGTRRLYAVFINNITYRVELGGTTYGVEMIRTGNMALADDHQLLGDMEFNGLINFGNFMAFFEDNLKKQERNYLGQSKLILDQYKIKVQGAPVEGEEKKYEASGTDKINFETAKIINDNDVDNFVAESTPSAIADQQYGMGTIRAEIDKNTSITEVLEKFVSRNSWIKNQAKTVRGNLSEAFKSKKFNSDNLDKMLFTISTHTELLQYDPLRRDYAKKFTYIINLMKFTTVLAAVRDEFNKDKDYTKKRVNHMISKRRLLKRYDYFNTGINLDVITFDLQYNFQYVYGLDTVVGLYNKYGKEFYSKFQEKNSSQAKMDKAGAVSSQSNWNAMTKDGINQQEELAIANHRYQVLRKAREAYTQGGVEPDANTLKAYNQLVEDYNNNLNEWERMNVAGDGGETMYDFDRVQELKASQTGLKPSNLSDYDGIGSKNRIGEQTFAEKIDDKTFMEKDQGIIVPVQFYERYFKPESEGVIGVGANSDFHTIMKNAKVGSNEMVNATIDIIGDPYWLDYTPSNSKFNDPKVANYRTEKVILFSSLGPGEVDPETGFIPAGNTRADEFLTALYRVWKVEHTFDNGQFTQRLSVIRDTITDLSLMQEAVSITKSTDSKEMNHIEEKSAVNTAKELDGVSTADVVGNDIKKSNIGEISALANKNTLTKNLNKGKLMVDGKEVSKEAFNKHYDKLQPKAATWNADKTRIIGGF